MPKGKTINVPRGMPGPKAMFRGKMRRPHQVTLTPEGAAALADGLDETRLSEADYIELLLRVARPYARKILEAYRDDPAAATITGRR